MKSRSVPVDREHVAIKKKEKKKEEREIDDDRVTDERREMRDVEEFSFSRHSLPRTCFMAA